MGGIRFRRAWRIVGRNVRTAEAPILVDNQPPRRGTVALVGEATTSEALTAVPSGFTGEDVAYEYRWQRCDAQGEACTEIGGAVERTYALRAGDVGRRVRAVVTASDGGGSVRVVSAASAVVSRPGHGPRAAASRRDGAAPDRPLTAWLERGRRRLRSTTVRWPARVRIRGRLDRCRRPPAAPHDGADARARRRPALARDRRRADALATGA